MASTASPVASWYPAAEFAPTVAAAQVYREASAVSRLVSALDGVLVSSRPPAAPPRPPIPLATAFAPPRPKGGAPVKPPGGGAKPVGGGAKPGPPAPRPA